MRRRQWKTSAAPGEPAVELRWAFKPAVGMDIGTDVKITHIYEGTNQIRRMVIARQLPGGGDLVCRYYERRLRSLSFPGEWPCCSKSCCIHRGIVLPGCHERGSRGEAAPGLCWSGCAASEAARCAQVTSRRPVVRVAIAATTTAMAASTAAAAG